MSSKVTLAYRTRSADTPGFRLYKDVLDAFGPHGGVDAPVYLRLEGVLAELSTMEQPGTTVVTVVLPRELALELGLVRANT